MKARKPEDIIKEAREAKGLTQQQVADFLGISLRSYQHYEAGRFPAYKKDAIRDLDRELGTGIYGSLYPDDKISHGEAKLATMQDDPAPYYKRRQELKNGQEKPKVPVYGGFTTLGNIEVIDDENMRQRIIAELPAEIFPGCDHAEKAKGDSMYPLIMNQALLVGKTCTVKGISYGEKYIIKTRDGLDTTKFVHPGPGADSLKLKAYNKSIPDQEVLISDIVFACRVQWIINPT